MAQNYTLNMDVKVNSTAAEANLKKVNKAASDMGKDSTAVAGKATTAFNALDTSTAKLAKTTQTATTNTNTYSKSLTGVVTSLKLAAAAAGVFAVAIAFSIGKGAIDAASNLQEATGKFDVVFRDQIDMARAMSTELQNSYGLSQRAAVEYLSSMQDLLKPMGMNSDAAAKMSGSIVKLAVDLGSFNNKKTEVVMAALQSALVGNYETMKAYGIILNETEVKAEAYRIGIAKVGEELTKTQKAQAAYSVIVKGSADAMGDFARTSGNYANQMRIFDKNIENFKAMLGEKLLPEITEIIKAFNDWAKAGENLQKLVNVLVFMTSALKEIAILSALAFAGAGIAIFASFIKKVITDEIILRAMLAGLSEAMGINLAWYEKLVVALHAVKTKIISLIATINGLSVAWRGALLAMSAYVGYKIGSYIDEHLQAFQTYRNVLIGIMHTTMNVAYATKALGKILAAPFSDSTVSDAIDGYIEDIKRNKRTLAIALEESDYKSKTIVTKKVKPYKPSAPSGGDEDGSIAKAQEFAKKMKDIRTTLNADLLKFYGMDYENEIQITMDKYDKLKEEATKDVMTMAGIKKAEAESMEKIRSKYSKEAPGANKAKDADIVALKTKYDAIRKTASESQATLALIKEAEKAELAAIEKKYNEQTISDIITAKEKEYEVYRKQAEKEAELAKKQLDNLRQIKVETLSLQSDMTGGGVERAQARGDAELAALQLAHDKILEDETIGYDERLAEAERFMAARAKILYNTERDVASAKAAQKAIEVATIDAHASILDSDRDYVEKAKLIREADLMDLQAEEDERLSDVLLTETERTRLTEYYAAKRAVIEKKALDDSRNALQLWADSYKKHMDLAYEWTTQVYEKLSSGIVDAAWEFVEGTKSMKDAFRDFAHSFMKEMSAMILKQAMLNAVKESYSTSSTSGGGGGYGSLIGGAISLIGTWLGSAKGNAFNNGNLVAYAKGGVVDKPTMFAMKDGMGLMGEAGPEAVVPLKRMSGGRLGVSYEGEADKKSKQEEKQPAKLIINNITSPELILRTLSSPQGQNSIMNVIGSNSQKLTRMIKGI